MPEIVWLGGRLADIPALAINPAPISRILILKLDHIGDFILSLRAMSMVREGFRAAHITLVCAPWNVEFARRTGLFDEILAFNFFPALTREWDYSPKHVSKLQDAVGSLLSDQTFDLAVDFRYGEDTPPSLYRVRARYRAGFPVPIEPDLPQLDLIIPYSQGMSNGELKARSLPAELRLQMLAATVVAAFAPPAPHPIRRCLATDVGKSSRRPFAVLSVSAGTTIRMWPVERFAEVGRALVDRYNFDLIVLGGQAERDTADRLADALPRERVQLVIGEPLCDLPTILASASLCISNDSGMSHLSAALDVPTVVVLSGQDHMEVWRPSGTNALAIGGWTPCQPCGLKEAKDCPWGVTCLDVVTHEQVLEACDRLLTRRQQIVSPAIEAAEMTAARARASG